MIEQDRILSGPGRSYCPRFRANITREHCRDMQRKAEAARKMNRLDAVKFTREGHNPVILETCLECRGKELMPMDEKATPTVVYPPEGTSQESPEEKTPQEAPTPEGGENAAPARKRCSRCKKTDAQEGVHFSRRPDGKDYKVCDKCRQENRDAYQVVRASRKALKDTPAEGKDYLVLEFPPDKTWLLSALLTAAKDSIRTKELQAIYYIAKGLSTDGYEGGEA